MQKQKRASLRLSAQAPPSNPSKIELWREATVRESPAAILPVIRYQVPKSLIINATVDRLLAHRSPSETFLRAVDAHLVWNSARFLSTFTVRIGVDHHRRDVKFRSYVNGSSARGKLEKGPKVPTEGIGPNVLTPS
eukprot:1184135-Prorocentrum_minimum.AAC.2